MKTLVLILISISLSLFGQETKNVKFQSDILNETRPINIHIPAAYKTNDKNYPVIYALDGEYAQLVL